MEGHGFSLVAEGSNRRADHHVVHRLAAAGAPQLLGRVTTWDWMITIAGVPPLVRRRGPPRQAIGADATMIWAGAVGGLVTLAAMFVPGAASRSGTARW